LLERAETRTGQNTEIKSAESTHNLRSGLVRSQKGRKPGRGTHFLKEADVKAGQNTERKQTSVGHLQTKEGRDQDWSGGRKKAR
jgi:hypothetical protein